MNRLLITGASGFIGREVLHQIAPGRYDLHAVSRRPPADAGAAATWHAVDLLDTRAMENLVAELRPTHLLHLAWDASILDYRTTARNLDWLAAGAMLARAFRQRGGQRAVYAGSAAEYQPELSLYATCKAAVAAAVRAYARTDRWHFAWGRIYWPYGPGGSRHRLVPYVIDRLLAGELAQCSPGMQTRDFVHVGDVASGLLALLESDIDGPVDIGSGEGTRVRSVVELIAEELGRDDLIRFDGAAPPVGEPDVMVASTAPLRATGWRPRPLREGLLQTIAWHRERRSA